MRHILLRTPGLDSTFAYHYLKNKLGINDIEQYYIINYCRYTREELYYLEKLTQIENSKVKYITLPMIEGSKGSFIPGRNVLFIAYLANFVGTDAIFYIGGTADDNIVDNSPSFCEDISKLIEKYYGFKVEVKSPFNYSLSKIDIAQWFVDNVENAYLILQNTFSCYNPTFNMQHCYNCPACFRRNVVLYSVGIKLPFYNKQLLEEYERKMKDERSPYNEIRREWTLKYINYLKQENENGR